MRSSCFSHDTRECSSSLRLCRPFLKVLRVRDGEADAKSYYNDPDEDQLPKRKFKLEFNFKENSMKIYVFVLNKRGEPLMPTSPAKARKLLKSGKARVVRIKPFTVQLVYGSTGYKQRVVLGVDTGYKNIGLSAVSDDKELFSSEVKLRTDILQRNYPKGVCTAEDAGLIVLT